MGQTINAEYYSSLLVQLKDILEEKGRREVTKGALFSHDNTPADWAQKQLKGRHFSSDAEIIAAAETGLDGQPSDFFF